MARKHEATKLLLEGRSPLTIARDMKVTLSTVKNYLYTQVGEGAIQRSDIVLSFAPSFRRAVEVAIAELGSDNRVKVQKALGKRGISADAEELYLYLQLRRQKVEYGDLYEWIRLIEVFLHLLVRTSLQDKYGDDWWRHLPLKVRQDCSTLYEEEQHELEHRFCCTTFMHLKLIYEKLWGEMSEFLPRNVASSKRRFSDELTFVNVVRNSIMHPVKGLRIDEESFRRVHRFAKALASNGLTPEPWGSVLSLPATSEAVQ